MGMVWVARLADDGQTAAILADPDSAYDFINPEIEMDIGEAGILDLDKEWHATHHLLTGSAEPTGGPLSLVLGSFQEVGEDNGYGSAWYVPPQALRAFSEAISSLDEAELRKRYNPDAMVEANVYIGDMYQDEGEEGFGFLLGRINELRKFADRGTAAGMGAFAVIT